MFKKTLAIALLACSIPAMANASWFLTTQAKSAGGTLTSSNGTQTVTDGAITKQWDTITSQTVSYAGTNAGVQYVTESDASASGTTKTVLYDIDKNLLGHVIVPTPTPYPSTFTFTPVDGHTYTFGASFAATSLPVSASISGGTVTPARVGNITYGYTLSTFTGPLVFTFSPAPGYSIAAINNVPAGATVANVPGAVNQRATVTFPVGYTFTSAFALSATTANTTPSISAILPQTVVGGATSTATLTAVAKNVAGPTYAWTYLSGPANKVTTGTANDINGKPSVITTVTPGPDVTLANAGTAALKVTGFTTPGQYKFLVKVPNGVVNGVQQYLSALTTVNVVTKVADAGNQCQFCHTANGIGTGNFVTDLAASVHAGNACSSCHLNADTGGHPGTVTCLPCHVDKPYAADFYAYSKNPIAINNCAGCHTKEGFHNLTKQLDTCATCHATHAATTTRTSCVDCHALSLQHSGNVVDENNSGVRAILGAKSEFNKTSHHIFNGVGVAPTDAQCVACHLEGKVVAGAVVVDATNHMADAKIHLRNAHTDADFSWDPAAATSADHTNMDNFCMSCHSAAGADSDMSKNIQSFLNTNPAFAGAPLATATNPFGDLLSNSYDKQSRVKVVDVNSQFAASNYSHHAVKAPKYTNRDSRTAWLNYSTQGHSPQLTPGLNAPTQKTLYDGGLMGKNAKGNGTLYTPLDTALAGATIGDNSQLHCGDCHTVGQWKANASTNADGTVAAAAIGAHGSNNEYMLRNSKGTDALHGLGTFICYNCHNDKAGGNTSGGYYATAYWNNTTGKWVNASANQHVPGIHVSAASTQYGGSGGCIGTTAGIAFTGYTSSTHNTVSWAANFNTAAPTTYAFADFTGDATFQVTTVPTGGQYVTFDTNGKIVALFAAGTPAGGVGQYTAGGNGNGISGSYDSNGTPLPGGWTGTGRNNYVVGNILGIGCMNCHNVGRDASGGGFGGIHGGSFTYTTGYSADKHGAGTSIVAPVGETQSTYRFMPGNGNYGYAPMGSGLTTGTTTNGTRAVSGKAAWESWNGVGTSASGGCYTNDYANQNAGWSGCNHHGNAGSIPRTSPTAVVAPNMSGGDNPSRDASMDNVGRTLNY